MESAPTNDLVQKENLCRTLPSFYEVERRYEELAHKMSTPDAAADAEAYAQMMRDYKELTP